MKHSARSIAWKALLQMEENEGYSNLVIDKALSENSLSPQDAALASTIFYGVLEKRITLDHYLGQCLNKGGKRLDPRVREALRCGAYQILFLDRVPDSAAVNETVELLKGIRLSSLTGFVNGVLRNLSRRKGELSLPSGENIKAWSTVYSVPEELISLWTRAYGSEITKKLLVSFQERPMTYVRVNPCKTTGEALAASLSEHGADLSLLEDLPHAAILKSRGSPAELEEFKAGAFHVQDLSAQWVCRLLDVQPGETVCDCCAAPGGKTFTIAQDMRDTGRVLSFDLYPARAALIESGARRLGLSNVKAGVNDASQPFPEGLKADRILCDVPCSGFGVIRRKPEIRYKKLTELKELPSLQYKILQNASSVLKPGGLLVYSTCTLNPAENEEVAALFLKNNPDFEPVSITFPNIRRALPEPDYMFTMMPFSGASDGFFAATFRRKTGMEESACP